ncbi:MAG: hypothetical protein KJ044_13900, partial [Planctomycetes bacterium]|nr:hypothetical protein [Planctomycetota bacterium]
MRIVEGNFDGLVESVGASRRLASRVGALARAGLHVTEALVELAADDDGKPLLTLLLSKSLLDAAGKLDTRALGRMAKAKWFKDNPVTVVERDNLRVLCLGEEADSTLSRSGRELAVAPGTPAALIAPAEARRLLPAEELARLKLDLVTSAEAGRRLEALRKLFLSGLAPDEKSALFLAALRDREPEVRAEAARALGAMGLDQTLTENLARASAAAAPERVVAIGNIGQALARLDGPQQQLALGALLELLRPSEDREVVLAVLGLLAVRLEGLPGAGALATRLHRQLVELLQVHYARYEDAARRVYGALFATDKDGVSGLLSASLQDIAQENVRFLLLSLITRHNLNAAGSPPVVAQLVNGLCTGSELDRNYQACAAALAQLGDAAVNGLVARLAGAEDNGKRRIIDLFGHMLRATEPRPLARDKALAIARALVDLYPASNAEIRAAILESQFYAHAAVDDSLRLEAVTAFVSSLHEFRFERQIELVQIALAGCGRVALEPLRHALGRSGHDVTRRSAAVLLPRIVEADPTLDTDTLLELARSLRVITDAEETDFPDRGPLFIALGRIAAHGNYPAAEADSLARHLREILGRTSAVYDVLEALGYLAAGANLSGPERLETGYLLLNVLRRGVPGPSARVRKNAEGEEVLHFGRETTAYTDMIPRILEGLGRMLEAPKTPQPLFDKIARDLIEIWTQITDYKRIWAPAATMTLANLLGQIALGSRRPDAMVDEVAELLS